MRRGLDTNVLVYAHVAALPEHGVVREFLAGQLARRDVTLVVTPSVLHELVHVVTDPRRFEPPVAMSERSPWRGSTSGGPMSCAYRRTPRRSRRRSIWSSASASAANAWPTPSSRSLSSATACGSS